MRFGALLFGVATALLGPVAAAFAQTEQIKVRPRAWYADWEGKVRGDSSAVEGTDIDVQDGLGIEEERANWVEVMMSQGGGRTWISLWEANPEEGLVLAAPETLDGAVIPAGPATGKIEIQYTRLLHERFILGQQILGFAVVVSFLSGFEYMDIKWSLSGGGAAGEKGMTYYRPLLGFRAEAWISRWLTLEAHVVSFFKTNLQDVRARTLEWQLGFAVRLERWSIEGGWRFTNFFAQEDKGGTEDIEMDIDVQGFYVGVGVSF